MACRWALLVCLVAGCGDDATPVDAGSPDAAGPADDAGADAAAGGDAGGPAPVRWERVTPAETGPLGRWGFAVADLGDDQVLLLGGTNVAVDMPGGTVVADAWRFDVATMQPTEVPFAAGPRYCTCAVHDPEREVVVMAGGRDLAGPLASETWELDLGTETWSRIDVESPPGTIGCTLAWAPGRRAAYLFGGGSDAGWEDRIWRYEPSTPEWVELAARGPSPRYDAGVVVDREGRLVVFAGSLSSTGPDYYADVWRFDPEDESWTQLAEDGAGPPGRRVPWMVLAPDGTGFYAGFGTEGAGASDALGDLWHFGWETGWTEITPPDGPSPRGFSQAIPGGPGLAVLLGGFDGSGPVRDIWRLLPR